MKQLAVEVASYFEEHQNWEALSEILDGYLSLQFRCGENKEASITIQRRLALIGLSFSERMDAISSITQVAILNGEYAAGAQLMGDALDSLRPGDPFESLGNAIGIVIWMKYLTGRWSEVSRFRQAVDEIWKRTRDIEGAGLPLMSGYIALLMIAVSREDQMGIESLEEMVRQVRPEFQEKAVLPLVACYRDGDFSQLDIGKRGSDIAGLYMMFFSEHEQCSPAAVMQLGTYYADDMTLRASNVARALAANDNAALAQAIDEAEEHQLIVHAAHMRIVLAKRTGDRSQLELARPILERLEDRLFLRKLHEVEKLLQPA